MVMEYFSHEHYFMNKKFQKNIILYAEFLYMDSQQKEYHAFLSIIPTICSMYHHILA